MAAASQPTNILKNDGLCDFEKDDGEIKDSYMYRQKSPIVTFLIENHVLYTNKSYAVTFSI